jgi:hypothetical protein
LKIRHLMILKDAKREINKLMLKGLDKPDVALLVLSWGTLSAEDMEEAAWYLHEWKPEELTLQELADRVEELERDK